MSAGQLDADAGPAQPLDGLPVQALGVGPVFDPALDEHAVTG
jgi:hypothetical protein